MQTRFALAGLAIVALAAVPAGAQDALPTDPFGLAMDLCAPAIAVGPLGAAVDALSARGWTIDYSTNVARDAFTLRSSNASLGGGAFLLAETAAPDGFFRMRCSVDIREFTNPVDLAGVAIAHGLDGTVTELPDGGVFGTWSVLLEEGLAIYSAFHAGDYFGFEMTWAEWGGPGG